MAWAWSSGNLQRKNIFLWKSIPFLFVISKSEARDGTDEETREEFKKKRSSRLAKRQRPFFEYLMQTDGCALQWNKLDWSPAAHLEKAVI